MLDVGIKFFLLGKVRAIIEKKKHIGHIITSYLCSPLGLSNARISTHSLNNVYMYCIHV